MTDDLVDLLARHPRIVRTNTPLEILAEHMLASLRQFEDSLLARSAHPFYRPGTERGTAEHQPGAGL